MRYLEQIGDAIFGGNGSTYLGNSISLSSDGSTIAIGASPTNGKGLVRIYRNVDGVWTQVGEDLQGEETFSNFGSSISISNDGSKVAIGDSGENNNGSGKVKLYQNLNNTWIQIGSEINGENQGDRFGTSVSLSGNGSVVAVGGDYNDENGYRSGHLRVFQYKEGDWRQIGVDIDGIDQNDMSGWSVSISDDGLVVAVGAPGVWDNPPTGYVRVYKVIDDTWVQIGTNIEDKFYGERSGWSIDLTKDGKIIAIGSNYYSGGGGWARVLEFKDDKWTQIGSDIENEPVSSLAISNDGDILVIGSKTGSGNPTGRLSVYSQIEGDWIKSDERVGTVTHEYFGEAVSISDDGLVAAASSIHGGNGEILSGEGYVSIYKLNADDGDATFSISGTSIVGQTLSISEDSVDPDGTGTLSYVWQTSLNGNDWGIVGTNSTYTITIADEGKSIKAVISYTDQQGFSEVVTTAVSNIPFIDNGVASFSISGTAVVGQTLGVTENISDADGTGALSYVWQTSSDGNNWNVVGTNSTYSIASIDEGKSIRAVISYTDGQGFSEVVTTSTNDIPYFDDGDASFSISGTAAVGQTLSITEDTVDTDGNGTLSYSWQTSTNNSNWNVVGINATYTVASTDEGKSIKAVVSYTDGQGFSEVVTTSTSDIPYIDDGIASFSISGTVAVGNTLSINENSADPDGTGILSYSWQTSNNNNNDWDEVSTFDSYLIELTEEGKSIRALVSYTDNDGFEEEVYSSVVEAFGNKELKQFGSSTTTNLGGNDNYLQDSQLIQLFNNGNSMAIFKDDDLCVLKLVNNQWILEYKAEYVEGYRSSYLLKNQEINFSENGEYVSITETDPGRHSDIGSVNIYNIQSNSINHQINIDPEGYFFNYKDFELSDDGTTFALGGQLSVDGSYKNILRIYKRDGEEWNLQASRNFPSYPGDLYSFGDQIALSNDGEVIAVATPQYPYDDNRGLIQVYEIDALGNLVQIGDDILGNSGEAFGSSIELSNDGSKLVVSSLFNGKNGLNTGTTRIYKNINSDWTQIGEDINSPENYTHYDHYNSIQISEDGSFLAIGFQYDINDDILPKGKVRLYENIEDDWVQIGNDIDGDLDGDFFGNYLSLSLDGATLAAGSHLKFNTLNNLSSDFYVNTYKLSSLLIPYVDNGDASFSISGTAVVGQTLSITEDLADADGNGTLSYSWQTSSDGNSWSQVGTNATYTVAGADEGKSIKAVVSYTDQQGFSEEVTTTAVNIPYVDNGDASFSISGTAVVGQTLGVTENIADADGTGTLSYSWQTSSDGNNWSVIGANSTYTIAGTDEGKSIKAVISYTDGQGFSEVVTTSTSDIPFVDAGVASFSLSGKVVVGQTLSISEDSSDPDGTGALSYVWQTSSNGNNWNVVGTNSTYSIASTDEGKSIRAVISYTDQQGFSEVVTTSTSNIPFIDNGDASFSISGTAVVGQTLGVTENIADADGTGTLSYSWQTSSDGNNWSVIGANSTYTIAGTDEGKSIKAVVSYTDQQGFDEVVTTSTSNIPIADNVVASFSISGTAIVGQTLSIQEDIADADRTGTLSYQWQSSSDGRLWSNVSTTSSYPLFFDDSNKYVRATISYTDDDGFSESITTDSVGVQKHAIHTSIDQLQTQLNNLTYSSNYDFSSLGYSEEFGSSGSDSLYSSSNEIVWGVGGNDYLENSYSSNDQILMGGSGDDTYRIKQGSTGIIYEAPSHGYDKLYLDSDYSYGYVASIDNSHVLVIEDSSASSGVIVIEAFSSDIEEIHYGGGAYSTNYFLSQLSSFPGYLGNLSWDEMKPYLGDLYVEELKNGIDLFKSNVIDVESSLETSRNTINNQITALQSQAREIDYSTLDIWSYLASNPGLINAIGTNIDTALAHYINYGRAEGRSLDTFNATQYLANNPDLAAAFGTDLEAARQHFVTSGYAEGRTDRTLLSTSEAWSYLASNGDLISAFGANSDAAVAHYLSYGETEGRSTNSFDGYSYLASNSDLINVFGLDGDAATQHYVSNGYAEGRSLDNFDEWGYLASNPDLMNVFGANTTSAIQHYISSGYAEGRSTNAFNATNYLENYADLAAVFGNDLAAATQHYVTSGYAEGRTDRTILSTSEAWSYLASNGDLISAFGANSDAAVTHYLSYGEAEGRSIDTFDQWQYLASHGDLINAFGLDADAATQHYVSNGYGEGRALDTFDEWGYIASNNDLLNAFGSDTTAAIEHYISFGMSEGRGTDGFNASSYLNSYGDLQNAFGDNQDLATRHYVEHGFGEGRTVVA